MILDIYIYIFIYLLIIYNTRVLPALSIYVSWVGFAVVDTCAEVLDVLTPLVCICKRFGQLGCPRRDAFGHLAALSEVLLDMRPPWQWHI